MISPYYKKRGYNCKQSFDSIAPVRKRRNTKIYMEEWGTCYNGERVTIDEDWMSRKLLKTKIIIGNVIVDIEKYTIK